jgi:hypothetical protein
MEPNAIAVLAGGAGALLMLLLVLLGVVGFAWPLLKSVIRFAGNFETVSLLRDQNGKIAFNGRVDDWREPVEAEGQTLPVDAVRLESDQ